MGIFAFFGIVGLVFMVIAYMIELEQFRNCKDD